MKMIEDRLMKYIPKKLQQYVTVLYEQCERTREEPAVYALHMVIDGECICGVCDGVKEIRWAAKYMFEHREFNF